MTTVVVIEDNRLALAGIELALAGNPALRVVASCGGVEEFDGLGEYPDLVVLDLAACPGTDSFETVSALAGHSAVVVVAGRGRPEEMLGALRAGALGLVTHKTAATEFLAAVEAVARGGLYLAADVAGHLGSELRQRGIGEPQGLARREIETLRLLANGYTHGQIARRLGLTEATVNTYVKRIRAKLNAGNKAELTRKAIDLGYVGATPGQSTLAAV